MRALTQACPLADKVVFYKVKDKLGGRVRLMISGGAPLARHVEEFLKVRRRRRVENIQPQLGLIRVPSPGGSSCLVQHAGLSCAL